MSKTPKSILPGSQVLRDTIGLRAAHPTGGKPKPGSINIGGGPKITPKPDKPDPGKAPQK
jgi:hypothetical protein